MQAMIAVFAVLSLHASAAEKFHSFRIVSRDLAADPLCKDMERFEDRHAQSFFSRARNITVQEMHDAFDVLDCEINGTMKGAKGASYEFSIQPNGVATVTRKGGKPAIMGCASCDDLFPPKK
jgi:hypothetical protein